MKSERIVLAGAITALLAAIALVGWQIVYIDKQKEPVKVSVIVNNSGLDSLINFKEGLKQGARDFDIRINIVSTTELASMTNEKEIIEKEISNGAEALILELYNSYNQTGYLEELNNELPIVLVNTDTSPEDVFYSVTADNNAIGEMLADEILADTEGKAVKVGIVAGNQEQLAMFQRLSGFRNKIEGSNIEIAWQISGNRNSGTVAQMTENQKENHADYCVALGNTETENAIDYYNAFSGDFEGVIYGVGSSEKLVYYLDNGLIKKLVVPDEFDMGYRCALSVAKRISYISESEKHIETECRIVDADSLYSIENQMIIFPEGQ